MTFQHQLLYASFFSHLMEAAVNKELVHLTSFSSVVEQF
jgi:hypothetical protein